MIKVTDKLQNMDVLKTDGPEISKRFRITENGGKSGTVLYCGRLKFVNSQRQFINRDWTKM